MRQCRLEQPDHPCGKKSGRQVDAQPHRPAARTGKNAGKHVVFFIEPGHAHQRVFGFFTDDVDDIVNRDSPEQAAVFVDHRRRTQIAILEQAGNVRSRRLGQDALQVLVDQFRHQGLRIVGDQATDIEAAVITVVAIDHEKQVGALR